MQAHAAAATGVRAVAAASLMKFNFLGVGQHRELVKLPLQLRSDPSSLYLNLVDIDKCLRAKRATQDLLQGAEQSLQSITRTTDAPRLANPRT